MNDRMEHGYQQTLAPKCRCFVDYRSFIVEGISRPLGMPALIPGKYRNPFHFIDEFDQWFEFEKRRHFDKESTYSIICVMLSDDLPRAARAMDTNYTALKRYSDEHFGRMVFDNRSIRTVIS